MGQVVSTTKAVNESSGELTAIASNLSSNSVETAKRADNVAVSAEEMTAKPQQRRGGHRAIHHEYLHGCQRG